MKNAITGDSSEFDLDDPLPTLKFLVDWNFIGHNSACSNNWDQSTVSPNIGNKCALTQFISEFGER